MSWVACLARWDRDYFLFNVAMGLHYIHSAGVAHGDLCPENVWLIPGIKSRYVKIVSPTMFFFCVSKTAIIRTKKPTFQDREMDESGYFPQSPDKRFQRISSTPIGTNNAKATPYKIPSAHEPSRNPSCSQVLGRKRSNSVGKCGSVRISFHYHNQLFCETWCFPEHIRPTLPTPWPPLAVSCESWRMLTHFHSKEFQRWSQTGGLSIYSSNGSSRICGFVPWAKTLEFAQHICCMDPKRPVMLEWRPWQWLHKVVLNLHCSSIDCISVYAVFLAWHCDIWLESIALSSLSKVKPEFLRFWQKVHTVYCTRGTLGCQLNELFLFRYFRPLNDASHIASAGHLTLLANNKLVRFMLNKCQYAILVGLVCFCCVANKKAWQEGLSVNAGVDSANISCGLQVLRKESFGGAKGDMWALGCIMGAFLLRRCSGKIERTACEGYTKSRWPTRSFPLCDIGQVNDSWFCFDNLHYRIWRLWTDHESCKPVGLKLKTVGIVLYLKRSPWLERPRRLSLLHIHPPALNYTGPVGP